MLTHVNVNFAPDVAGSVSLLFLIISFAVWAFCLFELEPKIADHYIRQHEFPVVLLLATWAISLAVIVLQVAFYTGHVAAWLTLFGLL